MDVCDVDVGDIRMSSACTRLLDVSCGGVDVRLRPDNTRDARRDGITWGVRWDGGWGCACCACVCACCACVCVCACDGSNVVLLNTLLLPCVGDVCIGVYVCRYVCACVCVLLRCGWCSDERMCRLTPYDSSTGLAQQITCTHE